VSSNHLHGHLASRRTILKGLAVAGVASLFPRLSLGDDKGAIDVHTHFASPAYIKALTEKLGHHLEGYTTCFQMPAWNNYSPAHTVEMMDQQGVAVSMLSCTTPGVWFGRPSETRDMCRELNEYGAKMVSDFKGRYGERVEDFAAVRLLRFVPKRLVKICGPLIKLRHGVAFLLVKDV